MANHKVSFSQDLTTALNLTLKPRRVVVLALGLLIGVAAAVLFYWLGSRITLQGLRWLSWIIQRIGAIIFAYVMLASMASVVAMAHGESTGKRIGVPVGWALIGRSLGPVATGTIKPIIVFIGLVAVIWLVGLLGLIPEVGPILWAFISTIVALVAGLLAIFILVKLFFVSFVFPTILSVTKQKGVACYRESVRFIKGHAVHVLGRLAVTLLLCLVFYNIILGGFTLTATHSSRTMGKNRVTLVGSPLLDWLAGIPGVIGTSPRGLAVENPASPFRDMTRVAFFRPRGTQRVGGWIFSILFTVVAVIPLSLPFLFFALSGYCAYMSFKDAPELPLKTEAVDWSEIKETAQEITGKRKTEPSEKPPEKKPPEKGT